MPGPNNRTPVNPNPLHAASGGREGLAPSDPFAQLRAGTLPFAVLVLALLLYSGIVMFGPKPPPKPDTTWSHILEEQVLRIGIDPSFPPFETDDGKGNLSGLDVALAHELVQAWSGQAGKDIRVQFVYTGFDGLYDALKSGQFDAILSALPYDPRKTEDVRFSHSYFNGGPLVVVQEGNTTVRGWSDLAGKRIGAELGSSGDSFARKWQRRMKFDLAEFNSPSDAMHALQRGQVDGVLTDGIAFEDFRRAEGGIQKVGNPLADEFFVIAVRKDATVLLEQINAAIDALKNNGRMEELQAEWF